MKMLYTYYSPSAQKMVLKVLNTRISRSITYIPDEKACTLTCKDQYLPFKMSWSEWAYSRAFGQPILDLAINLVRFDFNMSWYGYAYATYTKSCVCKGRPMVDSLGFNAHIWGFLLEIFQKISWCGSTRTLEKVGCFL